MRIRESWVALRTWWRAMPHSIHPRTKPRRMRKALIKRVCIPSRNTKSAERKREQKKRWFKQGQKWRTGCEGRISVLKRRHGLRRCLYKGTDGMQRWVGLGVIADNLTTIGTRLAK